MIEFFNRHCLQTGGRWDEFLSQDGEPAFEVNWDYRFKPAPKRMVTMYTKDGPVELVAPELEAPKVCSLYFRLTGLALDDGYTWSGDSSDKAALRRGLVFLTREDSQAMADFQRKQRFGDV